MTPLHRECRDHRDHRDRRANSRRPYFVGRLQRSGPLARLNVVRGPKAAQGVPKGPKARPREPKATPKEPQGAQGHPKGAKEAPQDSPRRPRRGQGHHTGAKGDPKKRFLHEWARSEASRSETRTIRLRTALRIFLDFGKTPEMTCQGGLILGKSGSLNPNLQRGRRASSGHENTGILHRIAVRIQWSTSRTTKLYKKTPDQPPKRPIS